MYLLILSFIVGSGVLLARSLRWTCSGSLTSIATRFPFDGIGMAKMVSYWI